MRLLHVMTFVALFSSPSWGQEITRDYPVRPVPFTKVEVADSFWQPRLDTNSRVTVWYDFKRCEETGRIDNFAKAGGLMPGEFRGIFYDDSDVYKVIEGASYTLALQPNPKLDQYLDELITKIAAAQEDDGYLYTARTLGATNEGTGPERWSHLASSHELYNVGHMYEAAVAHYQATGKRTLLDVAIKNANLIVQTFGPNPGQKVAVPGHQEIEIGLVKLYRLTGERRYLDAAKFFIDMRGRRDLRELYGEYAQDHLPLLEQDEAVGHAVRAGYLYAGTADVAALTGKQEYVDALDRIWQDVVSHKLHLTGGIGAERGGEAFGAPYALPNKEAYLETCAAIANALWNYRMFLLHGDAKYIDIVERTSYNGFLSGVALSGDRFFYPNPLASDGRTPFNHGAAERSPWFGTACCPVNIVRFIPSLTGCIYAQRDDSAYVNLFIAGRGELELQRTTVELQQETNYPWDGRVAIHVRPQQASEFTVYVRIPGWAQDRPVPSDLYSYVYPYSNKPKPEIEIAVNGQAVPLKLEKGFAVLRRRWDMGDRIDLNLPMTIQRVIAHEQVASNRGRVAVERGPIVYCVEGADHDGQALNLVLPNDSELSSEFRENLLGGIEVIHAKGLSAIRNDAGEIAAEPINLTLIPYYAWCHREVGPMTVWLATDAEYAETSAAPTLASRSRSSASHCWVNDTVNAMNDQVLPQNSIDHSIPRFTWWDHRGSKEWVQYDLPEPTGISGVEVYWFDDSGRGACRVPQTWRILVRKDDQWVPVKTDEKYGVEKDKFNSVTFEQTTTAAIRIEVELQPEFSGGILEWRLIGEQPLSFIRVSDDKQSFVFADTGKPFRPWGVNYDHDEAGRLIEDYWDAEWPKVEQDFREIRALGANAVRVHLQFGKFMKDANTPNESALDQLSQLVALAEELGLYLDLTGLGCYHKPDVPAWYDELDEQARWKAQANFWEAIAQRCANSPAIFCYDLMNEPVVPGGGRRDDWLGQPFFDKYFVQFISLDLGNRERSDVARAWIESLVAAIRRHDNRHLITVGLVDWSLDRPGLTSGFVPEKIAEPLDFLCVHIYPKSGELDKANETLRGFASVGKPVVIEEMFPLLCTAGELETFIQQSRGTAAGWFGFYWGKTIDEYRASDEFVDVLTRSWLELFQKLARQQE